MKLIKLPSGMFLNLEQLYSAHIDTDLNVHLYFTVPQVGAADGLQTSGLYQDVFDDDDDAEAIAIWLNDNAEVING